MISQILHRKQKIEKHKPNKNTGWTVSGNIRNITIYSILILTEDLAVLIN